MVTQRKLQPQEQKTTIHATNKSWCTMPPEQLDEQHNKKRRQLTTGHVMEETDTKNRVKQQTRKDEQQQPNRAHKHQNTSHDSCGEQKEQKENKRRKGQSARDNWTNGATEIGSKRQPDKLQSQQQKNRNI